MDIDAAIAALDETGAKDALRRLLTAYCTPAFGALPKRETDLLAFVELTRIGAIRPDASLYDMMTGLRVSRAKASQLLFEREVRSRTAADLDAAVISALGRVKFEKSGEAFSIEIEDPLLHAHLKERIRRLGHATDTSFNPAIVKMGLDAARDLIVDVMPEDRRKAVHKALVDAGAPDDGVRSVVGKALKAIGAKARDGASDMATEAAKDHVKTLLIGAMPTVVATFSTLLT